MNPLFIVVCLLCLLLSVPAQALDVPLDDLINEKRAQALFTELRCVVCDGQSLAGSDAVLARQMRTHIREMIALGRSDAEILFYYAARYGDDVLMHPPTDAHTLALWYGPAVLLVLGVLFLATQWRRKGADSQR